MHYPFVSFLENWATLATTVIAEFSSTDRYSSKTGE